MIFPLSQSRFDPADENDVRAIQGLYDCFVDKSHEFKPNHQANVVLKLVLKLLTYSLTQEKIALTF